MKKVRAQLQKAVFQDNGGEDATELVLLNVRFAQCPIKATLGVLGKKWTMLLLRDIGFRKIDRFNRLLESIPGLTPRVLSMRLKELENEEIITRFAKQESPKVVRWTLTERGRDALPILLRLIAYGSKWHADTVFEDKMPRSFSELFRPESRKIIREYLHPDDEQGL